MKYLLCAVVLLVGCNKTRFKIGDCVQLDETSESWEATDDLSRFANIFKVTQIGHDKYRMLWVAPPFMGNSDYTDDYISLADERYKKVECPKPPPPMPAKAKFKVGDCALYYTTVESEDGNTGRVHDRPKCEVTDLKMVVDKVDSIGYTVHDEHGVSYLWGREHLDNNYVRTNCDGKYP